eukprot:g12741.t1
MRKMLKTRTIYAVFCHVLGSGMETLLHPSSDQAPAICYFIHLVWDPTKMVAPLICPHAEAHTSRMVFSVCGILGITDSVTVDLPHDIFHLENLNKEARGSVLYCMYPEKGKEGRAMGRKSISIVDLRVAAPVGDPVVGICISHTEIILFCDSRIHDSNLFWLVGTIHSDGNQPYVNLLVILHLTLFNLVLGDVKAHISSHFLVVW